MLTRLRCTSAAKNGPNLFHHSRTVSGQISILRSASRSFTFRSESGDRTYIITTKRMISGDELKYRNGLSGLRGLGMPLPYPIRCVSLTSALALKVPINLSLFEKTEIGAGSCWRRRWVSNPRKSCPFTHFPGVRLRLRQSATHSALQSSVHLPNNFRLAPIDPIADIGLAVYFGP